jgi:hypothetical protein
MIWNGEVWRGHLHVIYSFMLYYLYTIALQKKLILREIFVMPDIRKGLASWLQYND